MESESEKVTPTTSGLDLDWTEFKNSEPDPAQVQAKFLGMRKMFAQISPNLPEKFLGNTLCEYFLPHRSFLG